MSLAWLETNGGRLAVLVFMLVFIVVVCVVLMITGHPLQETGKTLATGAVGSLLTLLYQYLKPSN